MPTDPGLSRVESYLREFLDFERKNSTLDRDTLCKLFSKERGELCQKIFATFQPSVLYIPPPVFPLPYKRPVLLTLE